MIEKNPFHQPSPGLDPSLFSDPIHALIGAIIVLIIFKSWSMAVRWRKRRGFKSASSSVVLPLKKTRFDPVPFDRSNMHLPENQVRAVAEASFETQPLLNKSEARLLPVIEDTLARIGRGHRVMAQTSLGEVLRPCNDQSRAIKKAAYASINSKRFDFAIIDRSNRLVAAIEYQGTGHYRDTSFIRDAVKREACRKAGVAFIEVPTGTRPAEFRTQLQELLSPETCVGAEPHQTPSPVQRKPSAAS